MGITVFPLLTFMWYTQNNFATKEINLCLHIINVELAENVASMGSLFCLQSVANNLTTKVCRKKINYTIFTREIYYVKCEPGKE